MITIDGAKAFRIISRGIDDLNDENLLKLLNYILKLLDEQGWD